MRPAWLLLVSLALSACTTYREDLNRGQRLYEHNEFDRALSIWRYLERDIDSLTPADQARYAYLRGMTDYRISGGKGGHEARFRGHARHWLGVAKAIEQTHPGGLNEQWKGLLAEALEDLNQEVWGIAPPPSDESSTVVAAAQPASSAGPEPASSSAPAAPSTPGAP